MASISFEQNVVIKDPKKIKEIKAAMASGKRAFSDIEPNDINPTKEKEIIKKWLCR